MKRIVIAAGGTGGHFYPGLVAAQTLKARGWQPLMIVRAHDPALPALERADLPALPVDLRGLPRRPGPELFSFAGKLAASLGLLTRALRAFGPDLALGMGGYLSFPLVWAAWRLGVPRALHESNAVLGLANAAGARLGARLFWGLPPEGDARGGVVVGTPVRPELRARRDRAQARRELGLGSDSPVVLAFGGSQGAQALNAALPVALARLPRVEILHLAGRGKAAAAVEAYRAAGARAIVREYLEDMAAAYAAADLVVCRAGASTLAELAAQRAPAVLIPYPHAAADHQDANARAFERAGACVRLPETHIDRLGATLSDLLESPGGARKRDEMASRYDALGLPPAQSAAETLADALERAALAHA